MQKNLKLIVTLFCFGIVIVFLGLIYSIINANESSSTAALKEYNNLFTKNAQSKLKIQSTVASRTREPISNYLYDDRFAILLFEINLKNNQSIENSIKEQLEHSDQSFDATEYIANNQYCQITQSLGKIDSVSIVNLKFEGDSIKKISKNDSFICYYFKLNTFSIGYNNSSNDLYGKSISSDKIPISLAFLKKNKSLYVLLVMTAKGKQEMPYNILDDIIKH